MINAVCLDRLDTQCKSAKKNWAIPSIPPSRPGVCRTDVRKHAVPAKPSPAHPSRFTEGRRRHGSRRVLGENSLLPAHALPCARVAFRARQRCILNSRCQRLSSTLLQMAESSVQMQRISLKWRLSASSYTITHMAFYATHKRQK